MSWRCINCDEVTSEAYQHWTRDGFRCRPTPGVHKAVLERADQLERQNRELSQQLTYERAQHKLESDQDGRDRLAANSRAESAARTAPPDGARHFDTMIGRLDRLLSEFLIAAGDSLDEADRQTVKHHAEDLIGVGGAAIKRIGEAP